MGIFLLQLFGLLGTWCHSSSQRRLSRSSPPSWKLPFHPAQRRLLFQVQCLFHLHRQLQVDVMLSRQLSRMTGVRRTASLVSVRLTCVSVTTCCRSLKTRRA